jgi:hypothetical protein
MEYPVLSAVLLVCGSTTIPIRAIPPGMQYFVAGMRAAEYTSQAWVPIDWQDKYEILTVSGLP